jgi:hypothetical protein
MGNGRERLMGKTSESSQRPVRVAGAVLVLLLAACGILGSGFRHSAQKASAEVLASPLSAALGKAPAKARPDTRALLSQLPMIFEPNQGQVPSGIKFVSRGAGYILYLDPTGAVLGIVTAKPAAAGRNEPTRQLEAVRMRLVGANSSAAVSGSELLPGQSNYFIGNNPKKWHTGIPQFSGVRYQNVYPGVDLVFYGSLGRLEYDFKVAPGADPTQAELQFEGASKLELRGGDLILKGAGVDVRLQAPQVYQRSAGQQQPVAGRFVLRGANRVGFEIGAYDHARELVIDPTISYSTYFGGANGATMSPSIAENGNGNIYLAGSTTTDLLPLAVAPPFQKSLNGTQNIFVAELSPTGGTNGLLAMTYLGGSGTDAIAGDPVTPPAGLADSGGSAGLAVDSGGNVYVGGTTTSTNFPTSNGYQSGPQAGSTGTSHVFVSLLNPTLSGLTYSTYLSGNGTEVASALAIDTNGDAFVTGTTTSTDVATGFPATLLPPAYQKSSLASVQFFLTEINTKTSGTGSLAYSTYFGGGNPGTEAVAVGGGIAVDTTGNVYFSGTTNFFNSGEGTNGTGGLTAGDFPITNAYQPCLDTVPPTTIAYPIQCTAPGSPAPADAFVAKLNPNNAETGATQLLFSTYFGGTNADSSTGLTIDTTASAIYITGTTQSTGFNIPTNVGEFQPCLNAPLVTTCPTTVDTTNTDAYVAKFTNPTETSTSGSTTTTTNAVGLSYFSYLGGSGNDSGLAIAVDTGAGALITGATSSGAVGVINPAVDFPVTTGAIQSTLNGTQNAFFAHIDTSILSSTNTTAGSYATYFGGSGVDRGTSITVDQALNTYFAGDTTSTNLQVQGAFQPTFQGTTTDAFAVLLRPVNNLCITCVPPVYAPGSKVVGAGNPISITFSILNQGPDLATNVTVGAQLSTGISATFTGASGGASSICSLPTGSTAACIIPVLQSGSIATVAFSVTPTTAGNASVTVTATNANNTNPIVTATANFIATNFTLQPISPSSQTVVAGNTATYFVQVAPLITFGNNVSLTCGSTPVGASCGFTPSTLVFNGPGAQSSTLNLTTTARPPTVISWLPWGGRVYALWLMVPGMAVVGLGGKKRRRNRLLGLLVGLALFTSIVPLPACSKAKQQPVVTGTPAGTYSLTVTATSGSSTQTQGFSLTVQ